MYQQAAQLREAEQASIIFAPQFEPFLWSIAHVGKHIVSGELSETAK
jgi:hypothetical protein